MPETLGGGAELPNIPEVELPSALRIRQRLGMIATSNSYREALIPAIAQLGGQTMSAEELVSELETTTADYAEEHQLGIVRQVQEGIPKIIDKIISDPGQKGAALDAWETLKAEIIANDDEVEQQLAKRIRRRPSRHQTRRAKRRGHY